MIAVFAYGKVNPLLFGFVADEITEKIFPAGAFDRLGITQNTGKIEKQQHRRGNQHNRHADAKHDCLGFGHRKAPVSNWDIKSIAKSF